MDVQRARTPLPAAGAVGLISFAVFGLLIGWRLAGLDAWSGAWAVTGVVIAGIAGAAFGLAAGLVLGVAGGAVGPALGRGAGRDIAAAGMVMVIPFVVLAAAAELLLGWSASVAFASAGLMTAGGAAGAEAGRRGARGLRAPLVPSITAALLATAWAVLAAIAATVKP